MPNIVSLSSKENTCLVKPQTWVFDERMGWVDVKDFLSKIKKLGEALKINLDA